MPARRFSRPGRAEPPVGLILVLIGLATVAVGTFALPWAAPEAAAQPETYTDLMTAAIETDPADAPPEQTFAVLYFSSLGVLLLAVVALYGIAATLPTRYADRRRIHRVVTGLACAVAIWALLTAVVEIGAPAAGSWVAAAGYLLVLAGVFVGPSRRPPLGRDAEVESDDDRDSDV
ncbi:MAG: hypothetical protein HOV79_23755 [Hamadaea sp.]|nr:hypothetical protein [Hamadaea sp.]